MATSEEFAKVASQLGITNDMTVVVYDAPSQMMGTVAWGFMYYGHKNVKILDFGVGVKENRFKFYKTGAIMPKLYTLVYALSIATSGNASKILLAGFDGYGPTDSRTRSIDEIFYLYSTFKESKPIIAVTPTSYSVASSSIYAL